MKNEVLCACGHSDAQHAVGYCDASSYCGCTKFRVSIQTVGERALYDYMRGWTDGAAECAKLDGEAYLRGYHDGTRARILASCAGRKYVYYEVEHHCSTCLGHGHYDVGTVSRTCPDCGGTGYSSTGPTESDIRRFP